MTSPISSGRVHYVDHLAFPKALLAKAMPVCVKEGLQILPRGAPSRPDHP